MHRRLILPALLALAACGDLATAPAEVEPQFAAASDQLSDHVSGHLSGCAEDGRCASVSVSAHGTSALARGTVVVRSDHGPSGRFVVTKVTVFTEATTGDLVADIYTRERFRFAFRVSGDQTFFGWHDENRSVFKCRAGYLCTPTPHRATQGRVMMKDGVSGGPGF